MNYLVNENYPLDSSFNKVYCINAAMLYYILIERGKINEKSYSYN